MSASSDGVGTGQPLLTVESREDGDGLIVALLGEFDLASARLVDEELERAQQSYRLVTLDLTQVTFMDSTGLHVVLGADERLREAGGTLRVITGSPQVDRLLTLTGALGHLHTEDGAGELHGRS
jgi:anti-sigma B factor antagonist